MKVQFFLVLILINSLAFGMQKDGRTVYVDPWTDEVIQKPTPAQDRKPATKDEECKPRFSYQRPSVATETLKQSPSDQNTQQDKPRFFYERKSVATETPKESSVHVQDEQKKQLAAEQATSASLSPNPLSPLSALSAASTPVHPTARFAPSRKRERGVEDCEDPNLWSYPNANGNHMLFDPTQHWFSKIWYHDLVNAVDEDRVVDFNTITFGIRYINIPNPAN